MEMKVRPNKYTLFLFKIQGAFINAVDHEQRSPVLLAAGQRCWRSVQILVTQGADLDIKDAAQRNILHLIIINDGCITETLASNKNVVRVLISLFLINFYVIRFKNVRRGNFTLYHILWPNQVR